MKNVVCIDNIEHLYIVNGKTYEVHAETLNLYLIRNEKGFTGWMWTDHFKDINLVREQRLNELGIG